MKFKHEREMSISRECEIGTAVYSFIVVLVWGVLCVLAVMG